jgi:thiol-disulfide isomerase/thioredoxin
LPCHYEKDPLPKILVSISKPYSKTCSRKNQTMLRLVVIISIALFVFGIHFLINLCYTFDWIIISISSRCLFLFLLGLFIVEKFGSNRKLLQNAGIGTLLGSLTMLTMAFFINGSLQVILDHSLPLGAFTIAFSLKKNLFKSLIFWWYVLFVGLTIFYFIGEIQYYEVKKNTALISKSLTYDEGLMNLIEESNPQFKFYSDTLYLLNFTKAYCLPCRSKSKALQQLEKTQVDNNVAIITIYCGEAYQDQIDLYSKKTKRNLLFVPEFEKLSVFNINSYPTELWSKGKTILNRQIFGFQSEALTPYLRDTQKFIENMQRQYGLEDRQIDRLQIDKLQIDKLED